MYNFLGSILLVSVLSPLVNKDLCRTSIVKNENTSVTMDRCVELKNIGDIDTKCTESAKAGSKFTALGDTVGCTQYDHQWHGSPKLRIVYDPVHNYTHVNYMKGTSSYRHMYYNGYDGSSWGWPGINGGTAVQSTYRDGYGAMDFDPTTGNEVFCMHRVNGGTNMYSSVWEDASPGIGAFSELKLFPFAMGDSETIWPVIAVDGSGDMIVVARSDSSISHHYHVQNFYGTLYYSRCSAESLSAGKWSAWTVIDSDTMVNTVSYNVFACKTSGSKKMCISWQRYMNDGGIWNPHTFYKESQDAGKTWGTNKDITTLIPAASPSTEWLLNNLRYSVGGTYGIYDDQSNIHLIINGIVMDTNSWLPQGGSIIWHYSSARPESTDIVSWQQCGAVANWGYAKAGSWNKSFYDSTGDNYWGFQDEPVISEDPISKVFYSVWTEFSPKDSAFGGCEVGDIFASYSLDYGKTWAPKMDLTMTPKDAEMWVSMAPIVKDTLRILYEIDLSGRDNIDEAGALDPNSDPFICMKKPVVKGDVAVLKINTPSPTGSLITGHTYTPNVTYKNNGSKSVTFQARFEVDVNTFLPMSTKDTLFTPYELYYDVKNVTLSAGETTGVAFTQWTCDTTTLKGSYYAMATMLIDTLLSNNIVSDTFTMVGIEETSSVPKVFTVSSTYPNPARSVASIKYSLPYASHIAVKVYDVAGQLVNTLINGNYKVGTYTTTWNGKDTRGNKVSTGLYFYRVEACSKVETRKITLVE